MGEEFIYEWAADNLYKLGVDADSSSKLLEMCEAIVNHNVVAAPSIVARLEETMANARFYDLVKKAKSDLDVVQYVDAKEEIKDLLRDGAVVALTGKPGTGKSRLIEDLEGAYMAEGKALNFFDEFWPIHEGYVPDKNTLQRLTQEQSGALIAASLIRNPLVHMTFYLSRGDEDRKGNLEIRNNQGDAHRVDNWDLFRRIDDILYESGIVNADAIIDVTDLKY